MMRELKYEAINKRQIIENGKIPQFELSAKKKPPKVLSLEKEKVHKLSKDFRNTHRIMRPNQNIKSEAVSPQKNNNDFDYMPSVIKLKFANKSQRIDEKNLHLGLRNSRKTVNNVVQKTQNSAQPKKKQSSSSPNKIIIRNKGISNDRYQKTMLRIQVVSNEKKTQKHEKRNLTTPSNFQDSNITQFEQEEMKKYPFYFRGERRINKKNDFTDEEGNPIVKKGDGIAYRYQILSELGNGAFGRVFKVYDHKKKQKFALKIIKNISKLNTQSKVQVEILELVLKEDEESRSNIVKIKGSFVFRGHSCLVYELLFCNLYEYMKSNSFQPTPKTLTIKFGIQILQALSFFKKHNIVHCDVKPENLMLREENKTGLKIIDVGSGCFESKQIYTYIQSRFYRAPEIILGIRYTPAIDMWSFGCVLAELQIGYPLFPGKDENDQILMFMELLGNPPNHILEKAVRRKKFFDSNYHCIVVPLKKKRRKQPRTLENILQTQDKQFIDLISRCLEWDPEKRIKPEQALLHDWVVQGIPVPLRARHKLQVSQNNAK